MGAFIFFSSYHFPCCLLPFWSTIILTLGVHLEGPFISEEKRGAHPPKYLRSFKSGVADLLEVYGRLDDVAMLTLAPELANSGPVIQELAARGIIVSVGE